MAAVALTEGTNISYTTLHDYFGHVGEQKVKSTAHMLGLNVTGKVQKCEHCAMGKARQKNIPKEVKNKSTTAGERLYFDISSVKSKSKGTSRFWLLVVDEATDYCWSFFLKKKSELSKKMIDLLKQLFTLGYKVKALRCDNAGENVTLQSKCVNNGLNISFEFTAPGTPQQNGVCE